jgi:hypothetical protein
MRPHALRKRNFFALHVGAWPRPLALATRKKNSFFRHVGTGKCMTVSCAIHLHYESTSNGFWFVFVSRGNLINSKHSRRFHPARFFPSRILAHTRALTART